jgi:hypothetical protein
LSVGFPGGRQVAARGLAFPFRRTSLGGDVPEALLDREFVHFGRTYVRGAGRTVAVQLAVARVPVTLMSALGALGGTLHVVLRDDLADREFGPLLSSSWARWAASLPESAMRRQ